MKSLIPCFLLLVLNTGCGQSQVHYKNVHTELSVLLDSFSVRDSEIHIHVDKSAYTLSIMADTLIIKQYPVVFGGNPVDDKLREGDRCTPEGRFRVLGKYPHRSWSKFIWIDYPTEESWEKHNRAKREGLIPGSARIGGQIGIHGVPRGTGAMIDLRINWTLGCISLKNKDINEFYPYLGQGSLVVIEK